MEDNNEEIGNVISELVEKPIMGPSDREDKEAEIQKLIDNYGELISSPIIKRVNQLIQKPPMIGLFEQNMNASLLLEALGKVGGDFEAGYLRTIPHHTTDALLLQGAKKGLDNLNSQNHDQCCRRMKDQ